MAAKWIVLVPGKEGDMSYEFTSKDDAERVCDELERMGFEPVVGLFAW